MTKIMKLHSVTIAIENGFVYLPTEASFPHGKHDDQADSTSQARD
jgi:phage terminase large subunit-like protein